MLNLIFVVTRLQEERVTQHSGISEEATSSMIYNIFSLQYKKQGIYFSPLQHLIWGWTCTQLNYHIFFFKYLLQPQHKHWAENIKKLK